MTDEELTFKETLELIQRQLKGEDPTEKQFRDATYEWDNTGPMSWYTKGRPRFTVPLVILAILVSVWLGIYILNWNIAISIENNPDFVTEVDFVLLAKLTTVAQWAGNASLLLGGFIAMYLHLNTWGNFEFQIEPAIVETLDGDLITTVIRVEETEEIFPYRRNDEVERMLQEIEEEELLKEIQREQDKLLEKESKKAKKEEGVKDGKEKGKRKRSTKPSK